MRELLWKAWYAALLLVLGVLTGLFWARSIAADLQAKPVVYTNGQRNYKIRLGENEPTTLRADRIERKDGCVVFYRQERVETLACEGGVGAILVTEVYE